MTRRSTQLRFAALAAVVVGVVGVSACGGGSSNGTAGKQLFTQKCGSCHALEAAQTKGTAGPDLDDAFSDSLRSGIKRSTVRGIVLKQIAIPRGTMPAKLVTGDDAEAVSDYVANSIKVSGKPSQ